MSHTVSRRRPLRLDVITLFPDMFPGVVGCSMLKRAQQSRRVTVHVHDLRDYTHDRRRTVDARPYGGGPGMVLRPEPLFEAVMDVRRTTQRLRGRREVILMAAQGEPLTHALAKRLSTARQLTILCGHYEGVDARVGDVLADREVSIGDYVLTGGELPALVLMDAVIRLVPGVLGHAESATSDSFGQGLLEYPQYTRPEVHEGHAVPEVLLSGNHRAIAQWRKRQSMMRTADRRPDLLASRS